MKEKIGKIIKALREGEGWTQKKLAGMLGSDKSLISNYENGYNLPTLETLIKLADIFDVSLDELVGRKPI